MILLDLSLYQMIVVALVFVWTGFVRTGLGFGVVSLPVLWLNSFIYSITLFYGFIWLLNRGIESHHAWADRILLVLGGYVAGISLTGAPLMVAVYMRNVSKHQLRDTLFVLWFIIVSIKMTTFVVLSVNLHFLTALTLLPVAAIGHILGLKAHNAIMRNDLLFKRWIDYCECLGLSGALSSSVTYSFNWKMTTKTTSFTQFTGDNQFCIMAHQHVFDNR